jgi:hypothetical protein
VLFENNSFNLIGPRNGGAGGGKLSVFGCGTGRRISAAGLSSHTLIDDPVQQIVWVQVRYLTSATSSGRIQRTRLRTEQRVAEAAYIGFDFVRLRVALAPWTDTGSRSDQ